MDDYYLNEDFRIGEFISLLRTDLERYNLSLIEKDGGGSFLIRDRKNIELGLFDIGVNEGEYNKISFIKNLSLN